MHGKKYEKIKKGRRARGAVFLTLLLIVGLALSPCMSRVSWATEGGQADPGSNTGAQSSDTCSLMVNPGTPSSVTVDLYKVAAYDAPYYEFGELTSDFADVEALKALADMKSLTASKYQELAKEAGRKVLESGDATPLASASGSGSSHAAFQGLSTGLYLMIVQGSYNAGDVTTTAASGSYYYTFAPQLIALPSTQELVNKDAEMKTSDGEWIFNVTAELKYESEPIVPPTPPVTTGDLEIVKNLLTYESRQKATFVYHITVTHNGVTKSYEKTIICTDAGESAPVVITGLPVGATVDVTEVYEGANYSYKSVVTSRDNKTIEAAAPLRFTFTNDYDTTDKGGGSIVNKFPAKNDGKYGSTWKVDNKSVQKTYGQ